MDVSASASTATVDSNAASAFGNGSGSVKAYQDREQKSQDDAVTLSGAAAAMNAQVIQQAPPVTEANRAQQAVTAINTALKRFATSLEFTVDPGTLTDTGQTLRQMPTEDAIKASRELDQQKGLLIGQKV
jgi:uncharacterized FlaG/YvyC family protein